MGSKRSTLEANGAMNIALGDLVLHRLRTAHCVRYQIQPSDSLFICKKTRIWGIPWATEGGHLESHHRLGLTSWETVVASRLITIVRGGQDPNEE